MKQQDFLFKKARPILSSSVILMLLLAFLATSCNENAKQKELNHEVVTDSTGVKESAMAPLDSATKMQNFIAYSTPSEMHKEMATWDGKWDAEAKFWMPDVPEPFTMKFKSENKLINNRLISASTHVGDWNGMPFSGYSQTGFDNHRGVVWNTWQDNMSSGLIYSEGSWDATTKTANLKGKMTDAETKQHLEFRQVLKIADAKTQMIEQYITRNGKESKTMEMVFKRK